MNRFDPSQNRPSDSIRSDIDATRHRMDNTIDQLTERLKGRHLVDELLGYLRSGNGSSAAGIVKDRVSETTSAAVHAVADAVKSHPLPLLVVGAGIAWLIYEREQKRHAPERSYASLAPEPRESTGGPPAAGNFEDYTPGYSTTGDTLGGSESAPPAAGFPGRGPVMQSRIHTRSDEAKEGIREKAAHLGEKAAHLGEKARQSLHEVRQRASDKTAQVRERTRELAGRTRQRVSRTAREHPLETGLTCLAAGLLAGLFAPAPQRMREEIGPVAERVKQRATEAGGDILERGKRVVVAAAHAARQEAEEQGLTPDAMMRRHGGEAGSPAGDAGDTQRPKGDWPGQTGSQSPPTPAAAEAMSGDEQRVAGDIVQPKSDRPQT